MPSGSSSSGPPWEGDAVPDAGHGAPPAASELEKAARAMRSLAAGRFEVVGPLGQDRGGEFAFLGRDALGRLVVLKRDPEASTRSEAEALQVIERLDSSVPPPAGSCPVCQAPFADWDPACATCGADVAGSVEELGRGLSGEQLLDAVRNAAEGYEVLGGMPRAVGGAPVYFARDPGRGDLVALRLDRGVAPGRREGYTVAATRMMRPKHLYGTVGGEGSGFPSPPGAMRAASWVPASSAPLPTAGAEDKVCPQCGEVFGGGLRFCPKDGSALRASAPAAELVGQVIAERYHILDKLGEGGMGRVYLAEHVRMGRRCALKVMNPRLLHDPDSVGRFNREAANASRINHPNVAAIYDFGETADDIVYLAMELVEGESLAAILGREGIIPEQRTIQICLQIAEALGAAHDLGIVHRDLKPDNVMISRSRAGRDQVKVVDFGIAKATQGGKQTVTRTGYVLGTPAYMSPEQILGQNLDGRSDLYSLGCILYEMLAGQRAFAGPSGEVSIHQRLTEPPPNPRKANPNLSRKLADVVTTAMARSAEQRFPTASALGEALNHALSEGSQASGWRGWLPGGLGRLSPAPPPAPNSPAATTPVPLGWTEAVQPLPSTPGHNTTLLRHRSARPKSRGAWVLAGSGVGVVLVVSLLWKLLALGPAPDPSRVLVNAPDPASTPPAPAPPAPTTAPSPTSGAVRLPPSLPADVQVTVDGVDQPLPPDGVIELAPGRHSLVFRAPGVRRTTRTAEVTVGDTTTLDFELIPVASGRPPPDPSRPPPDPSPPRPRTPPARAGEATVNVAGDLPPGAEISVDGRPLPAETRLVKVTPGMHWLKVSAVGYRPDSTQVRVDAGSSTVWQAPRLERLARPGPEPAPPATAPVVKPPLPVEGKPSQPATPAPGPAPSEGEARAEIQALLSAYEGAINARSLSRLKALYPDMTSERESQWRDLFSKGVRDLKAALSVGSIRPISSAGQDVRYWLATFTIHLTFKPDGGSAQSYRIRNTAGVNRESGQWRFATLEEAGE